MSKDTENKGVGASIPVPAIIAALVTVLVIVIGLSVSRLVSTDTPHRQIIIATGPETGTYHALGKALKRVLESSGVFAEVEVRPTDGSVENMQLIREGGQGIDLGFVQGDAAPSTNARLLTVLYEEVLHIMVSKGAGQEIDSIYDLQGRRVSLGPAGSGTRELSQRVLRHFGVEVGQDMIMSPEAAAVGLAEGSLDAAFMLTAIPSRLIAELARSDTIRFISLGSAEEVGDEAHALELVFPGIQSATIPRSTYIRWPRQAVHTVSVSALLIARKDLEEELARDITTIIFGNRAGSSGLEGNGLLVARKIREDFEPANVTIPYHPGATAYYRRQEPPFFVEYAEALSLGLTLMLAVYSTFIATREWMRRRMKNRVDAYLLQVEELSSGLNNLDHDDLLRQYAALEELRRAAFADLIAERLLADEAFTILQSHLRDELAGIEARLRAMSRDS